MVKPVSPCFRHGETPITNKMEHTLILTDKPEVGKTIARIIGADKRGNGYMAGGGYIVTWTFGNMLSLAMPKDYGKARVERKDFPLVPRPFQLMVKHVRTDSGWIPDINAVKQLKVIEKLLPECSRIIAATDASREGELLFRQLYRYLGCSQPVLRLWISSLTEQAVREGMKRMQPLEMYDGLFLAGDSRAKADWLLGMNASYALCRATGLGNHSLGRVQTPVLAAISGRYRDRENHIASDSWHIYVSTAKEGIPFKLRSVDTFHDRDRAEEFHRDCSHAGSLRITTVTRWVKELPPPALYSLGELQKDAGRYYGLTVCEVHDIAQSLYEKKLISYPRTSCRTLSPDVAAMLPDIMGKMLAWDGLKAYVQEAAIDCTRLPEQVIGCDSTAHPAIIATGVCPGRLELDRREMQVYLLVVGRMLETFMPPCKVECTTVDAVCAALRFRADTFRIVEQGWHGIFGRKGDIAPEDATFLTLPDISAGETLPVPACSLVRRCGLPPSPYTDAQLVEYMEKTGLGTSSTRAAILRTLLDRKYIRYSGKYIIPTRKGLYIYETVRSMKIADPSLTSGWEAQLEDMEQGKLAQETFLKEVSRLAGEVTDEIFRLCGSKGEKSEDDTV